ncbi:hypothetical protein NE237_014080 [Protea cynaroides]|uniref:Protein kinase domain-containing protein n=1 Tax=Protea cynaroides TaxID=273540 RepID=A0A9Q0H468_9MAGN|nr:hypothetical protein NE237_014080 [Protea cynaroides]
MSEGLKKVYQVREEIGRGRFGTVFRCFSQESVGEFLALKSIDKRLLVDSVDQECVKKESKIMQLVKGNPNVVGIKDVYEDETYLDIVMELCDSSDLYDRLTNNRSTTFSEVEAAAIMLPLMEAIAHCHRKGVAHRDIKPDNILFDSKKRLKLADFGSADFFDHDGRLMTGVVGTPYYVAPEVLSGRDYNEKVDIWSAGVIMYVLLSGGIPPFPGDTAPEIFEAVLRGNLRFPTRIFSSISPAAKDLLRKMLSKDVSKRFSAEQVIGHLWFGSEAKEKLDQ